MKGCKRIKDKIISRDELKKVIGDERRTGLKQGFTNGCFDILHRGHVLYLEEAAFQSDLFIVALNSDESVKRLKGESRPINGLDERMSVIAALGFVDYVTSFEEDTPIRTIELLRPDYHFKAGDYNADELPESASVRKYGGEVRIIPFHQGYSSSSIIERSRTSL